MLGDLPPICPLWPMNKETVLAATVGTAAAIRVAGAVIVMHRVVAAAVVVVVVVVENN